MSQHCPTAEELARRRLILRRSAWSLVAGLVIAALTWKAITAPAGVADPTASDAHLSHGAVVVNTGPARLREGLEAVLVLAAFTASFVGDGRRLRRPVAGGAALALVASIVTWFAAIAVIGALGGPGLDIQAATGLLAVAVLLVVMNWFFHKIYWTGWISAHNRRRRNLLNGADAGRRAAAGTRPARLHGRLPRGLRGRPLSAEPAHHRRLADGARGRRARAGTHRRGGRA